MMFSTPFHKQTDPAKQAGQIINRPEPPSNHDMMDDMAEHVSAKEYKPVHGGYPEPIHNFAENQWWVAELDSMAQTGTDDQKRAVAVVHHLLKAVQATPFVHGGRSVEKTLRFGERYSIIGSQEGGRK